MLTEFYAANRKLFSLKTTSSKKQILLYKKKRIYFMSCIAATFEKDRMPRNQSVLGKSIALRQAAALHNVKLSRHLDIVLSLYPEK